MIKTNSKSVTLVLIMHQGLGDCIMTMPSYISIISDVKIVLIVKSKLEEQVFRLHPRKIAQTYFVGAHSRWMRFMKMISAAIRVRMFAKHRLIIAPIISGNMFNYAFLKLVGGDIYAPGERIIGNLSKCHIDQYDKQNLHYVNYIYKFFEVAGLIDPKLSASINRSTFYKYILPEVPLSNESSNEITIAVAPGCGVQEYNKIPSVEWFVGLLAVLNREIHNVKFFIYGGPTDKAKIDLIVSSLPSEKCSVLLDAPIANLVTKLRSCNVIIAGTTGPGHVASLVGKPIVILSEMTNPSESGPYSSLVNHARASLVCSPCYRRGYPNGCMEINCTNLISYCDVLAKTRNSIAYQFCDLKIIKTKVSTSPFMVSNYIRQI